jgi:hypothetical protein
MRITKKNNNKKPKNDIETKLKRVYVLGIIK